ncbi:unnamed protein product [Closterium sp. Naga37s-1]|nr:unnamed protein product [Closterium sp. Naga37s-1]
MYPCSSIALVTLTKPPAELNLKWIDESWADVPKEMVRKEFLTCGISNAELEMMEDATEDELVPNPFYPAPAVIPPYATVEAEEEAVLAAEAAKADEEALPPNSDSSESGDGLAGNRDEWSDEGDEWWAPGRYEGEEVDEWVAGDDED